MSRASEVVLVSKCPGCFFRDREDGLCCHPRVQEHRGAPGFPEGPDEGPPPAWCPLRYTATILRVDAPVKRRGS